MIMMVLDISCAALSDAGGACIWCGSILPPWIEKVRRTDTSNAGKSTDRLSVLFPVRICTQKIHSIAKTR